MKATIVAIESASKFTDKERRVTLRFQEADSMFSEIRIAESKLWRLGLRVTYLDQIVEFMSVDILDKATPAVELTTKDLA